MPEKEPLTFREAPEVEEIARPLIRAHHRHLINQEIRYLFGSEPEKVGGKTALGTARKVTGLNAYLAGQTADPEQTGLYDNGDEEVGQPFFVMRIWEFGWTRLRQEQRIALVDHELCHMFCDEGKISILPHDLEEFNAVVARHGLWRPDVEDFVKIAARKAREDHQDLFASAMGAGEPRPCPKPPTSTVEALMALGYRRAEAESAVENAPSTGDPTTDLRQALQVLYGAVGRPKDRFEEAARLVVANGRTSAAHLEEHLDLSRQQSIVMLDELGKAGVIESSGHPQPKAMVTQEQLEAILAARRGEGHE